ncbi:hypothetical protein JOQ06_013614 [Pogonophryne albipinna]|uniref:Uncharacterized protein n=1 Tax=Pogonophryne albipinna TaxID=1090488 RepID=A0AAD6BLQ0_9TELE|nr:hypothetical protein JOQ06_013614 [Pogonophryne albipinna]
MSDAMACIAVGLDVYNALLQEQEQSRRRRARLQQAIGLMEMDVNPIAILNPHVPVLAMFFDGQKDLMKDYRLGRQSLEALLRILPSKSTQGWSHESTVCRLVHTGVKKIAALRPEVIKLPPILTIHCDHSQSFLA